MPATHLQNAHLICLDETRSVRLRLAKLLIDSVLQMLTHTRTQTHTVEKGKCHRGGTGRIDGRLHFTCNLPERIFWFKKKKKKKRTPLLYHPACGLGRHTTLAFCSSFNYSPLTYKALLPDCHESLICSEKPPKTPPTKADMED